MINALLTKIVGSKNERTLKRLRPQVERINAIEPRVATLSDEDLRGKKGEFLAAIMLYAESVGIDRAHVEETNVALIALEHDEALDASEYALALWQQTVQSPLQELADYHASGLKPEDVARLVQAASLVGVAVGVNR